MKKVQSRRILSKETSIRSYRAGDEQEIVELLEEAFNGWPKLTLESTASDHWKWKYVDIPKGDSMILVAEADEIIGVVHSIPYKLKIEDHQYNIHYIGDLVVHPAYRRHNVAKNMIEISIEERRRRGIRFSYFVTSNPILIKYNLKMEGVQVFPHKIVNMVRIRDIDKQLSAMPMKYGRLMKIGYVILDALNKTSLQFQKEENLGNIKVKRINKFHEEFDDFWQKMMSHYDFIVTRDAMWLNWRYCDPRASGYQIIKAEKDSELVGYCVYINNRYNPEYPVGYIVELLTLPGETKAASSLLREAVNYFNDNKVNIINCLTVKNHALKGVLAKQGFLDSRMPVYVFTSLIDFEDEFNKLRRLNGKKVYISYGDLDSLPVNINATGMARKAASI